MTHFSLLSDLINLSRVLEADRAIDLDERKQRDRAVGLTLQHDRNKPASQIRAWLYKLSSAANLTQGQQGARLYHLLCVALVVAGFIAGWGLASVVLFYDGKQPINIVNTLVILVLPQLLLLLLWVLTALPLRLTIISSMGAMLGFLNPGRLARHAAELFAGKDKQGLDILWHSDHATILMPATRWLFSFWSQLFAFCFNIGILAKVLFLVSFSDLAFVWSTTLTINDGAFHQLLTILSTPWAAIFADAVPSAELVANSRYFRLDEGALSDVASTTQQAITLGQWWPFLLAAISCYGLLPRLLTLGISWYRFRHHMRTALCNLPGAPELLARMNSPLVSTLAEAPEQALNIVVESDTGKPEASHYTLRCPLVDWSGACSDESLISQWIASMGIEVSAFHEAGGRLSTQQDAELMASLCGDAPDGISVLVKAWEPPMLEFLDFLRGLRQRCGEKRPIVVLMLGDTDNVDASDRETWQLTLAQLGDPNLHVESVVRSL